MPNGEKRSAAIDLIRILGTVAIVAGHTWSNAFIRDGLYTWHVAVFFLLSGYLWRPCSRSVREEARNRFRSLLVPYLIWLGLISVAFIGATAFSHKLTVGTFASILLGGDYIGKPYSAFWFVTALFVAVLALRLLEQRSQALPWTVALIFLSCAYVTPEILAAVPGAAAAGLASLVFVLGGARLRHWRHLIKKPLLIGLIFLAVAATLIVSKLSAPLDLKDADFGTPLVSVIVAMLISVGLILVAERFAPNLPPTVQSGVTGLARVSFGVILSHSAILWLIDASKSGLAISFAAALIVPWCLALLVSKTPLSPWLLGVPAQARRGSNRERGTDAREVPAEQKRKEVSRARRQISR